MAELKYKVIKSKHQYSQYCNLFEELVFKPVKSVELREEIELLTVLIEKWDKDHSTFADADPITLIKSLLLERIS